MEKQGRTSRKKQGVTGVYITRSGNPIAFSSQLQRDAFLCLDFEPSLLSITSHPSPIEGHKPACRLDLAKISIIVEVAYESELVRGWSEEAKKYAKIAEFCAQRSIRYSFFTDSCRTEQRNRIAVLKQVRAMGDGDSNGNMNPQMAERLQQGSSVAIRELAESMEPPSDYPTGRKDVFRRIVSGELILRECTSFNPDDSLVSIPVGSAEPAGGMLIPYERLAKRVMTHPLRFAGDLRQVSYYPEMKELKLGGYSYSVLEASHPEAVEVRCELNGERYKLGFDTFPISSPQFNRIALQLDHPERFEKMAKRHGVISTLALLEPEERSKQVPKAAEVLNCDPRTIWRYLAKYRVGGSDGLVPSDRIGGRGASRLDARVEGIIQRVIQDDYLTNQRLSVAEVVKRAKLAIIHANESLYTTEPLEIPCNRTIYSRVENLDLRKRVAGRRGSQEANDRLGVFGGSFPDQLFPLHSVMIDHTPLDIRVIDEVTGRPFARAWLTIVEDVYSRCVCGYYLGLKQPAADSVGLAIIKSVLGKEQDIEKFGLNWWDVHGVPYQIHMDNGKDFASNLIEAGCIANNIAVMHRPVRTPRFGAHIERLFRTFEQSFIHTLPGTTFSNPIERGEYRSDHEAILSVDDLEAQLLRFIEEYHLSKHSELGMTPKEKWEQGIQTHGKPRDIPKEKLEEFRVSFLPYVKREIHRDSTVRYSGVKYYNPKLSAIPSKDKRGDPILYTLRYDPYNMNNTYLWSDLDGSHIRLLSNKPTPEPLRLKDLRIIRRNLAQKGLNNPTEEHTLRLYKERMEHLNSSIEVNKSSIRERAIPHREEAIRSRFAGTAIKQSSERAEILEEFDPSTVNHAHNIRLNLVEDERA